MSSLHDVFLNVFNIYAMLFHPHRSKRSIVAKWAEIVGDDIRNKRGNDYKEYRYRVMHGLKEKFEDRPRDTDDGESRESDDEPYPIRDLYLKYRKDKVILSNNFFFTLLAWGKISFDSELL